MITVAYEGGPIRLSKRRVANALRLAARLIEKKFTKGILYEMKPNKPSPGDICAARDLQNMAGFCANGAITAELVREGVLSRIGYVSDELRNFIVPEGTTNGTKTFNKGNLVGFNDSRDTKAEQVAKLFRTAARKLEHGARV